MIDVSRGLLGIYHRIEGLHKGHVIITDFPLRWTVPIWAIFLIASMQDYVSKSNSATLMDPKIKNRSRLFYLMANIASQFKGEDNWALLLDTSGFI